MTSTRLAFIGGTGLYEIEGARVLERLDIDTPWGKPSDSITVAEIDGVTAAFLPRHGRGHRILPGGVNSRANIAALKIIGVEEIIAFSAVGSLKEEIRPLDFVIPDQVIDRTRTRVSTFFETGAVGHIAFADPFCGRMHGIIESTARESGLTVHTGVTLVCMEGPAFSTRAESRLYKSWGAGIINMSTLPEAKLAREAEICYAVICMSTDYDSWKEDGEHVTIDVVINNLNTNSVNARALLKKLVSRMGGERTCPCCNAARNSIITADSARDPELIRKLKTIYPYL
jgi:5'-methylthioadenosine phosphorylase